MISIYTERNLITEQHRKAIHPLLLDLCFLENPHPSVAAHYRLTAFKEDADVYLFPLNYLSKEGQKNKAKCTDLLKLATSHKKKLMVYAGGDYGTSFRDPSIIVWRTSGFKSSNDQNTIILPALMPDPLDTDFIKFYIHDLTTSPQISFTGFASNSVKESLRIFLSTSKNNFLRLIGSNESEVQKCYNAAGSRYRYLKQLEVSKRVNTDFIYREAYRAGARTEAERIKTSKEFFKNINDSPYTFCLRGAGNFSVRFYESLACGRIPVLIDTDVQLPLENVIEWNNHICRISTDEKVSEALIKFHNSFTPASFEQLQKSNRMLYENYLVRHRFFCTLHDILKEIL